MSNIEDSENYSLAKILYLNSDTIPVKGRDWSECTAAITVSSDFNLFSDTSAILHFLSRDQNLEAFQIYIP